MPPRLIGFGLLLLFPLVLAGCQAGEDEAGEQPGEVMEKDDTGTVSVFQPGAETGGLMTGENRTGTAATMLPPGEEDRAAGEISLPAEGTPLTATLEADRREARPGESVHYTLMLSNTSATALSALDAETTFLSNQVTVLDGGGASYADDRLRWAIPVLAGRETRTLRYKVSLSRDLGHGDTVLTILTVNGSNLIMTLSQTHALSVIERLPRTGGEGRLTSPVENTIRFLRPVR